VLAGTGRPPAGAGGSVILLSGALPTGLRPGRAVRPDAGHGERRALDRRQNGGQRLAGLRRSLALLLLLLGSRGGSSQPAAHRAQPANLRPRLEDAIRGLEHEHRTEQATNDQADHEFPRP